MAREAALQMLYAREATTATGEQVIYDYWREMPGDAEGRAYADQLVLGVEKEVDVLDQRIAGASTNWRIERMTRVDRNLLRLGAWELTHELDVPRAVIIDEVVEMAKRFSTEESSAFVNGVLDRIAEDAGRTDDSGS